MPREPVAYRDNLEDLLSFFGGKRMLNIQEVTRYCGKDVRWVKERFHLDAKACISVPTLARMLSEVSG